MPHILVVDDEPGVRESLRMLLKDEFDVTPVGDVDAALALLDERSVDAVLLDLVMPGRTGIDFLRELAERNDAPPVIVLSATRTVATAIEAMKLGAYDYLLKPLDVRQLEAQVQRALSTRRLMNDPVSFDEAGVQVGPHDEDKGDVLIGRSPKMLDVYKQIGRVAAQGVTVLIRGESGTGKEVVARAIYHHSQRVGECFMAVNCAALHDTLLESELFGHEKGAFTDAHEMRRGKFELAEGGTIFLDEIGDMSLGGQAKLLRVLEQKVITRVGGSQSIPINVRVIAATNANLAESVRGKKFREDLYFRLNVVTLDLPPLRERPEDVLPLAMHFLAQFATQARRTNLTLSGEAERRLQAHSWPGNVRELRNLMERVAFLAPGEAVEASDLAFILSPDRGDALEPSADMGLGGATNAFQQSYIRRSIRRVRGNMSEAARLLGLHRSNLYRKMRQLGMSEFGELDEAEE